MAKRRIVLTLVILFFIGFPLAGMVYVYSQAHSTMRASALKFASEEIPAILKDSDLESLMFFGTIEFKERSKPQDFELANDQFGEFESVGEFKVIGSDVSKRRDQRWQEVTMVAPVKFARAETMITVRVARRSLALAEWKIDDWRVGSEDME